MSNTIELPVRKIAKKDGGYVVTELKVSGGAIDIWKDISKVYAHSTSAFAALGRLTQKDTLAS